MSHLRHAVGLFLLAAVPVLGGWSSCEPNLNEDPSFDQWCGAELCYWQTDAGSIRRVATWHPDDYGVELLGSPAAISQRLDVQPLSQPTWCFRFDTLAEIDPNTTVMLQLDYGDDGLVDYETPVAGNDWAEVEVLLSAPSWYPAVRFRLSKTGPGRAVVAHLRISASSDCTVPPPAFGARPLGANCESDDQCESGVCAEGSLHQVAGSDWVALACGTCRATAACEAGQVCRLEETGAGSHLECAAPAAAGAYCRNDADCASGTCGAPTATGLCSGTVFAPCETDADCQQAVGSESTCWLPGFARVCE